MSTTIRNGLPAMPRAVLMEAKILADRYVARHGAHEVDEVEIQFRGATVRPEAIAARRESEAARDELHLDLALLLASGDVRIPHELARSLRLAIDVAGGRSRVERVRRRELRRFLYALEERST